MDLAVCEVLHANLYAYKRFVGDILVVSSASTERILDCFQRFGDRLVSALSLLLKLKRILMAWSGSTLAMLLVSLALQSGNDDPT